MGPRVRIEPGAYLLGAASLLILPFRWFVSAMLAASIHEICHYAAIRLLDGRVLDVSVGAGGAVMRVTPMSGRAEALCALAGPAGSFLMLLLIRWIPELGICAGIQGFFNLLPIYPLDGGRILRCLIPENVCDWIEKGTLFLLTAAGIAASAVLKMGGVPLILVFSAMGRALIRKIPCKEAKLGVQ